MSDNYTSFLICFHENRADVFREGLPLGVVTDGVFKVHEHKMPDGSKHPVKIDQSLIEKVGRTIEAMNAQQPVSNP